MTDVVQGALIGAISASGGAIISTVMTLIISRQQNKANLQQFRERLEFEKAEAKKSRLIKIREYLIEIKHNIGQIEYELLLQGVFYTDIIKSFSNDGIFPRQQDIKKSHLDSLLKTWAKLIGQVSDNDLCSLLETHRNNTLSKLKNLEDAERFFADSENKNLAFPTDIEICTTSDVDLTRQISERIEQLLCGDD